MESAVHDLPDFNVRFFVSFSSSFTSYVSFFCTSNSSFPRFPKWLRYVWMGVLMVLTPGVLATIAILSWVDHEDLEYNGYVYPDAVQVQNFTRKEPSEKFVLQRG